MAEWLAIVSGNTAQVFNAESGDLVSELRGHPWPIWKINFESGGQQLVTASADGTARLWKANCGTEIKHICAGSSGRPLVEVPPVGDASAKSLAKSPQEPANGLFSARAGNCHSS
jgi:WD40 repeat protein